MNLQWMLAATLVFATGRTSASAATIATSASPTGSVPSAPLHPSGS